MHISRKKKFPNLGSQSLTPLRDRAIWVYLAHGHACCIVILATRTRASRSAVPLEPERAAT